MVDLRGLGAGAIFIGIPIAAVFGGSLLALETIENGRTVLILSGIGLVGVLRVVLLMGRSGERIVTATLWVYVVVFLSLVPLLQMAADRFPRAPHPGDYPGTTTWKSVLVVIVGLAAFELGRALRVTRKPRRFGLALTGVDHELPWNRSRLLAVLAVGSLAVFLTFLGWDRIVFVSRASRDAEIAVATVGASALFAILQSALRVPAFVAWTLVLNRAVCAMRRTGRISASTGMFLGATGIAVFLVTDPLSSARFWLGTVLVGSAFIVKRRGSLSTSVVLLAIVTGVLVVFPAADVGRSSTRGLHWSDFVTLNLAHEVVEAPDFDSFQQIMNSVDYAGTEGNTAGRQLLGVAMFWVPRRAWPDKPIASGNLVSTYRDYPNPNTSMPLWGELFLDAGFVGVCLGFLVYGWLVGLLDDGYEKLKDTDRLAAVLVPVFAAYQFYLLRGSLLNAIASFVPVLVLLRIAAPRPRVVSRISVRR